MEKDEDGGASPAHKSWGTSLGDGQLDGDRWFHILFKLFFPVGVYLAFLAAVMNMSVVGRIIGMRADHIISAVVCGSLTIAFIVAFIAKVGARMYQQGVGTLVIFILMLVQVACVAYLVQLRYKMSRERTRSSRED